jgi:hypothetical protein
VGAAGERGSKKTRERKEKMNVPKLAQNRVEILFSTSALSKHLWPG